MRTVLTFLLVATLSAAAARAQRRDAYQLNAHYGYLLPHSPKIEPAVANITPAGLSFIYNHQTDGSKSWHQVYDYPQVGFSLSWYRMENVPVLGNAFAASIHVQKAMHRRGKSYMTYRFAPGVMYASEIYDSETNPLNNFLSTRINLVADVHLRWHWRLNPDWELTAGPAFAHYSNGGFHHPNLGMNILSATVGLVYAPDPLPVPKESERPFEFAKGWSVDVLLAGAAKRADEFDSSADMAVTLQVYGNKRVSRRSGLVFGVDAFRTETVKELADDSGANVYRAALVGGHELYVGRVAMILHVGGYFYRPEQVDRVVYWRWGLKHYVTPRLFWHYALKAHLGTADVVEWGVGYRFGVKNDGPFPKRRALKK